jgi:hypothetical protein
VILDILHSRIEANKWNHPLSASLFAMKQNGQIVTQEPDGGISKFPRSGEQRLYLEMLFNCCKLLPLNDPAL